MTLTAQSQTPDFALRETANARASRGTHLHPNADDGALFVARGSGALGDNQQALAVQPGAARVGGADCTIETATGVDIDGGVGDPRRDVVYLALAADIPADEQQTTVGDGTFALAVRRGDAVPPAYPGHIPERQQNLYTNAHRPSPPDLADIEALALAVITVPQNAGTLPTGAIDQLRAPAPSVGETGTVDGAAIQSSLDGRVVAVAPGVGVLDAIDPTATATPIQDAIDIIEATGVALEPNVNAAGSVLLPPGVVETPGMIALLGGKRLLGHGRQSSVVRVTDSSNHGFALGGAQSSYQCYLDGFAIDGGDRAARTAGSAIDWSAVPTGVTSSGSAVGSNIGQLEMISWGGSDPVMYGTGRFSSHIEYIRGDDYDGTFLLSENEIFDNSIQHLNCQHSDPDSWVVDIQGGTNGQLFAFNAGGNVGKLLRANMNDVPMSWLGGGFWNAEPNQAYSPTIAGGVVELQGVTPTRINHVSVHSRVSADYGVGLSHGAFKDRNPGRKRLESVLVGGSFPAVALNSPPESPSHYGGPSSDINYNGHPTWGIEAHGEDSPHGDGWVYDQTITGATGGTALARGYDALKLDYDVQVDATGGGDLWLRPNAQNVAAYSRIQAGGTTATGDNRFRLADYGAAGTYDVRGTVVLRADTEGTTLGSEGLASEILAERIEHGYTTAAGTPLSSLSTGVQNATLAGTVDVYGRIE